MHTLITHIHSHNRKRRSHLYHQRRNHTQTHAPKYRPLDYIYPLCAITITLRVMGNTASTSQHGGDDEIVLPDKRPARWGASATLPNRGHHHHHHHHNPNGHHHHHHHHPDCQSTLGGRGRQRAGVGGKATSSPPDGAESSRVLFLLYLIHRTWNVVVDSVDPSKSKR